MKQRLVMTWTLVLVVLTASAGEAQDIRCLGSESPHACFTRGTDGLPPLPEEEDRKEMVREEAKEEGDEKKENLRRLPTGVDTAGTALASNTKNFLPLIAMSGLLGEPEKDDAKGTYTFDLNFLISGLAKDKNAQLQAVANSRPEVAKALADQLPEDTREATVEKLKQGLGDLDDYTLSFTYSPMGRRIGRGFEQHRNRFEALVWGARDRFLQIPPEQEEFRALGNTVASIRARLLAAQTIREQDDLFLMSFDDLEKLDAAAAAELKQATEAAADEQARRLGFDRRVVADAGLELFGSLVNNQPQLNVSVQQRFRDPLVGGDETAAKVTFEWGLASLNKALGRECRRDLDQPEPELVVRGRRVDCLAEYKKFVNANKKQITDGTRFSFSGEYSDIGEEPIDRPELGVTGITLKGATKVILSAGYTRLFPALGSEQQPLRLDFVGSYEDVSDDPARQDRGVATLTVTRKVNGVSVPFGIVYANHGEFLGEVDEKLSAHVGLKFDLFGSKDDEQK